MLSKSPRVTVNQKKKSLPVKGKPVLRGAAKMAAMKKAQKLATATPIAEKKVSSESRSFLIGLQLAIAGSAIAVLVLLAAFERNIFSTLLTDAAPVPVTIGLEHTSPLSLGVLFARKQDAGYVSINNNSSERIFVNLPSAWSKMEVTGTELKNVTQDIPVFGFTRYSLPAGARMQLLLPDAPSSVFFDSTSSAVTAVELKTVDLTTSQTDSRVVLVQKQSLVQLWGAQE